MRMPRLKITGQTTCYHVMSHLVEEVPFFDDLSKEVLRRQMWNTAYFCGVNILTYAIMGNHFHILLRLPAEQHYSDEELIRRYRSLYPTPNKFQIVAADQLEAEMKAGGKLREAARKRILKSMGDLSLYMKLLKQRFSIWYNKRSQRRGTLWAERFKSVVVENSAEALQTVAAYIDLNPVRAGLVEDPKDYRFCGYGEWIAGKSDITLGFKFIFNSDNLSFIRKQYRMILFGKGSSVKKRDGRGGVLDASKVTIVLQNGGELPRHEILRCRIRYFSDGCIIGSQLFLEEIAHKFVRDKAFLNRPKQPGIEMQGFESLALHSYRQLRGAIFG